MGIGHLALQMALKESWVFSDADSKLEGARKKKKKKSVHRNSGAEAVFHKNVALAKWGKSLIIHK